MADIKRYNNLETQTMEGEWVKHSDHLAAVRAAVAEEREELRRECCNLADQYGAMEAMAALFDARSK